MTAIWSRRTSVELNDCCNDFHPDLIHVHNTFPLISPSLYWAAGRRKLPVVQTLHNFRLICPQAMLFRGGGICEDCVGRLPWRAVAYKCYRGSVLQSGVSASMLALHRMLGTYDRQVACYIALNRFCKEKFIKGGLPAERLRIKPNFVVDDVAIKPKLRSGGLFVGRLSHEKGIHVLMQAASVLMQDMSISVIGKGPLEDAAARFFKTNYLGFREPHEIRNHMAGAEFLVVPSIGMEAFGMVVIEAFACGTPVIASAQGGLADLIEDGVTGLLVQPGDAADLAAKIAWAKENAACMLKMGQAARKEYERKYTPERNYRLLMQIYEDAISETEKTHYRGRRFARH